MSVSAKSLNLSLKDRKKILSLNQDEENISNKPADDFSFSKPMKNNVDDLAHYYINNMEKIELAKEIKKKEDPKKNNVESTTSMEDHPMFCVCFGARRC